MSAIEAAVEVVKTLPPDKLAEAVTYLQGLRNESLTERVAIAKRLGGSLSPEESDKMERALAECRQIDKDEW
jgi:hypothetical protein